MGDEPITSYGVILFSKKDKEKIFLLYQRRDSYEYTDLIRGAYSSDDRFKELVSCLCPEERERLLNYSFKQLWDDLWVSHNSRLYYQGYEAAYKKFEKYKSLIQDIHISSKMTLEPPWGFPKGRKSYYKKEEDIDCAIREFSEETGLSTKSIRLIESKPFVEIYRGNNNKSYKTEYFIAESDDILEIKKVDTPQCIRENTVSDEASNVKWFSFGQACLKLEPRRQIILKGVIHFIDSIK